MQIDSGQAPRRAFLVLVFLMLAFGVLVHATATGQRAGGSQRIAASIVPGKGVARGGARDERAVEGQDGHEASGGNGSHAGGASAMGEEKSGVASSNGSNAPGASGALTPEQLERFELGRSLYATCATCHGANGEGVGENPPLRGAPIAIGPVGRFARVLIDGMTGPVVVNGKLYNGVMPASQANDDEDLAAVMTFVRRSFGNKADPVTPEQVAKVKAETEDHAGRAWTWIELEKVE